MRSTIWSSATQTAHRYSSLLTMVSGCMSNILSSFSIIDIREILKSDYYRYIIYANKGGGNRLYSDSPTKCSICISKVKR